MFLKTKQDGSLLEVVNLAPLFDPFAKQLEGRLHAGEELQELELFDKADLQFPSGEPLPRCWWDPAYPHN
ncbi:acetyltransferase [Vulcanococcus sp.]|jgi:hypothetical protein|uniref:acetyltransferase n=1 Tax=Vulcanococcus sp. TaxID=2856995 RepID=UPI0010CF3391|nr:hypothetical protein LBMAG39_03020 [Cyanobium sp.]